MGQSIEEDFKISYITIKLLSDFCSGKGIEFQNILYYY